MCCGCPRPRRLVDASGADLDAGDDASRRRGSGRGAVQVVREHMRGRYDVQVWQRLVVLRVRVGMWMYMQLQTSRMTHDFTLSHGVRRCGCCTPTSPQHPSTSLPLCFAGERCVLPSPIPSRPGSVARFLSRRRADRSPPPTRPSTVNRSIFTSQRMAPRAGAGMRRSASTTHALPRLVEPGAEWRSDLPTSGAGVGVRLAYVAGKGVGEEGASAPSP
ncbi:hypothetical protein DFH08DRAFT_350759 [Mycena albidolilacea]|uniref:Uncharacterized protein n=1 Tax=Mycena albidolilacea TaxID=1033008 RepID=A0AAD6ZI65_9AGAR|nr:hypothetical protein DFH08DRAFT_350759 [Mycena albidolilacea]